MHDEACPTYTDMIENMAKGHAFIAKNFPGNHPRIGWQIDPFGHSNTNMRLFSDMGFDAVFMARMDRHDKATRLQNKRMEFIWRPSSTLGNNNEVLAHLLIDHYRSPTGLGFDILDN